MSASRDLDRLLFQTGNATIDPSDHDPVETATNDAQFRDLYARSPTGAFTHINQGSLEVPVASETLLFFGASDDLSRVIFADDRQLEPGIPAGNNVYVRDGQTIKLVSKDENDVPISPNTPNVVGVSSDGSKVAFVTASQERTLWVWSAQTNKTVRAVGPLNVPVVADIRVDWMSADGHQIVFSTAQSLVAEDTDTSKDLYEYDDTDNNAPDHVTLLSAPDGGGPRGNSDACAAALPNGGQCDVAAVATTDDGATEYFVSPEQLVAGQGVDGAVNLYVATQGAVRFIAVLDPADPVFERGSAAARNVRLTADDKKLVFESHASLTGYDNDGHTQVYIYDSTSGTIRCASCRPSGVSPTSDSTLGIGASADEHGDRVFFNSLDAILPEDTNNRSDVYQYSVATGTVALISSGTSERDSTLIGNGLNGRDVFFRTTDTLVPEDQNGAVYKIYDARIGSVPDTPSVTPACQGASCRPNESAPQAASQGTDQAGSSAPPKRPVAPSRLVVTGSRTVKGISLRLTAKVSGAGRLKLTGSGLAATSVKASRADSYHLTARLSKASAAKLRRTHRVTVTATVRYTPNRGTTRTTRVRLTFTAAKSKGR